MLKFIKHHMTTIEDIEIFPIISLLMFVSVFTIAAVIAMRMKKTEIEELENTPLED
jgi:cytochrome c oxidase cbb3-type subunit IV